MHAYLVGSPCAGANAHQRHFYAIYLKRFNNLVVCHRIFYHLRVLHVYRALYRAGVKAYRLIYSPLFIFRRAVYERHICLMHRLRLEEIFEKQKCFLRTRDYHNARGIAVEPMHDAAPLLRIIANDLRFRIVFSKPAHNGFFILAVYTMYNKTGRLIDNQKIGLFVYYDRDHTYIYLLTSVYTAKPVGQSGARTKDRTWSLVDVNDTLYH